MSRLQIPPSRCNYSLFISIPFRHAGLEEPAPYSGYGGIQNVLRELDVLARFGELRLPSVARLEFIPMKIGAGMTTFFENLSLWTDSS